MSLLRPRIWLGPIIVAVALMCGLGLFYSRVGAHELVAVSVLSYCPQHQQQVPAPWVWV
ncbi:hypothetical protein [Mycobacterium gastri]|uniref:hypothetical protein n=1 Tax=Mycobacterium gastri TaxID=1777 RepID=UPI0003E4AFE4|nr:hypothetical protein [Mycobacterium gastri]ETW26459.1 hypothetical protein MGAST_20105 [Mycobacterium gastri 'Wayne']